MSIYTEAVKLGVPLDNHESDLYMLVTIESSELLKLYPYKNNVTTFISNIDGDLWFDIPFAYDPHTIARG